MYCANINHILCLSLTKVFMKWLCENKWKETTTKCAERACVSLIPALASIPFRLCLVLSIGGVTVQQTSPPPLSITYYVWAMLTKSQIVNTFRLGNLSLLTASRSSVRFSYSPYFSSFFSSSRFFFDFCFLWLFAFLRGFGLFFSQVRSQSSSRNRATGSILKWVTILKFLFEKQKKTKINDFLECLISVKLLANVLCVKCE